MSGPTTLKLGYTDPRTDTFGAHPALGGPLDLNDGVTYTLASPDGLDLLAPTRTLVPAGNVRTPGERVVRAVYRHNRQATLRVIVGPTSSYAAFSQALRTLHAWASAAPAQPVTLQWQPPSATQPVYLDVVGGGLDVSVDEGEWLRGQLEPVELVFVVRPGLRGDRRVLANLVTNPGFEQVGPCGAFDDPLANFNAYTVQAGGALSQDVTGYQDVAGADSPLVYYRLNETSGTTAYNAGSLGGSANGTTHGSPTGPTQGAPTLLTAGSDPCYTFAAASSQYVSASAASGDGGGGGPSGNGSVTLEALLQFAANPAANAMILTYGGGANGTGVRLWVDPAGKLNADATSIGGIVSAAALATGTPHHVALTWDGTTLTLYADGVSVGVPTTPGALSLGTGLFVGASATPANFWNGQLDEVALYATALSAARVAAHDTAFHTAAGALANSLLVPPGGRISFGAATWGPLANWQLRVRVATGGSYTFFPHYVDANNHLQIVVAVGAAVGSGSVTVNQVVGGVTHQLAQTTGLGLVPGTRYWLRITLGSAPVAKDGEQAYLGAELLRDVAGSLGSRVALVGAGTFDTTTAMTGAPQLAASGAGLGVGGPFAHVHQVTLFGPGGWQFVGSQNGATGTCWPFWERDGTQTYPGGPVTSFACARMDLAGSGTVDCLWRLYAGGSAAGTSAIPVGAPGDTLAYAVAARSVGLGASATLCVVITEYDASGTQLRQSGNLSPKVGNQPAWTLLAGSYGTGANCAFVDLALRGVDAVSGASANGQVWWDNAQAWDVTRTGVAAGAMPYCELRFAQSPAQLVVSGLEGDLPCPALLQWGTYLASFGPGSQLSYAVGRRGSVSAGAQLVGPAIGYYGTAFSPVGQLVVDPTAYGGVSVAASVQNPNTWRPRGFSPTVAEAAGVYHLLTRFRSLDPTPGAVQVRARTDEALHPWYLDVNQLGTLGVYWGPWVNPLSGNGWTVCDAGQVRVPAFPAGALSDPTQRYAIPLGEWNTASGTPVESDANWLALLPVDGSVVLGQVRNAANSAAPAVTASYLWAYVDGLLTSRAGEGVSGVGAWGGSDGPSATYSVEGVALPNAAHAGGGPGTQGTATVNVNGGGDPSLTLDPTLLLPGAGGGGVVGGGGINQLVGYVADAASATPLSLAVELAYTPLYVWPR